MTCHKYLYITMYIIKHNKMVKKFIDFIEEGMWSKTFDRARTGEERIEDKSVIKDVCKTISEIISEHLNIPYKDDICTFEGNVPNSNVYQLHFKFKRWDFTYDCAAKIEDPLSIAETMIAVSTSISIGIKYYRNITNTVKKILEHVSNELMKIVRNKYIQ